jgi:hypothetical protein
MLEMIDILKREALEAGGLTLSTEQTSKLIFLLETCQKTLVEQRAFIEKLRKLSSDSVRDKSW